MKIIFLALFLLSSRVGFAKAEADERKTMRKPASVNAKFSAFTQSNRLYATVLGDSCNKIQGMLKVSASCDKDRLARNAVVICDAELRGMSTAMGCSDNKIVASVIEIDLARSQVDPSAQGMKLTYGDQTIELAINR